MEIKVGQWVRTVGNTLENVIDIDLSIKHIIAKDKLSYISFEHITKVANDPRELIEAGDLVFFSIISEEGNTMDNFDIPCNKNSLKYIKRTNITKILTKNSNGGFDLQYSKEAE
jgi:hypothetical protein